MTRHVHTMLDGGYKRYRIVIDPGHGGQKAGNRGVGPDGVSYQEKRLALAYALTLAGLLVGDGRFDVVVTRTGDYCPTQAERVGLANDWGAHMYVACHLNGASANYVRGVEICRSRSRRGDLMAKSILSGILGTGLLPRWSTGVKRNDTWYVLKHTQMPAVHIQMGFMSNPDDMAVVAQVENQVALARGVYTGISQAVGKLHITRSGTWEGGDRHGLATERDKLQQTGSSM